MNMSEYAKCTKLFDVAYSLNRGLSAKVRREIVRIGGLAYLLLLLAAVRIQGRVRDVVRAIYGQLGG